MPRNAAAGRCDGPNYLHWMCSGVTGKGRLAPTSPATFGIYLQKMCLFSERGDLIFARHGTVLASKAKREAPTEAVGCMLSVGRKGKIGIVDMGVDHAQF